MKWLRSLLGLRQVRPRPTHLYRYRPINAWLEPLLLDDEIFLSSRAALNDPCETFYHVNVTASDDEIRTFCKNILSFNPRMFSDADDPIIRTAARLGPESPLFDLVIDHFRANVEEHIELIRARHQEMIDSTGICCFSGRGDSTLMFAHYAENHQGCCVEFGPSSELLAHVNRVIYLDKAPTISVFTTDPQLIMSASFLCKSRDWEAEEEWRFLRYPKGVGPLRLHLDIRSVTLGYRADDAATAFVADVLRRRQSATGRSTPLFRARVRRDSYGLDRVRVMH